MGGGQNIDTVPSAQRSRAIRVEERSREGPKVEWSRATHSLGDSQGAEMASQGSSHAMQIVPASTQVQTMIREIESSFESPDGRISTVRPQSRVNINQTPPTDPPQINAAILTQNVTNVGADPGLVAALATELEATKAEAGQVLSQQHIAHTNEKLL